MQELFYSGKYNESYEAYHQAKKLDPNLNAANKSDVVYWIMRGTDLSGQVNGSADFATFNRIHDDLKEPDTLEESEAMYIFYYLGMIGVCTDQEEKIAEEENNSENATITREYIKELLEWALYDETNKKIFDEMKEKYPSQALTTRALALTRLGNYSAAIDCYTEALEIDPSDVNTWDLKAKALDAVGRYDEAVQAYKMMIQKSEEESESDSSKEYLLVYPARYHLMDYLMNLTRYEEAIQVCNDLIEMKPRVETTEKYIGFKYGYNYQNVYRNKAIALKALGRTDEANATFALAGIDPNAIGEDKTASVEINEERTKVSDNSEDIFPLTGGNGIINASVLGMCLENGYIIIDVISSDYLNDVTLVDSDDNFYGDERAGYPGYDRTSIGAYSPNEYAKRHALNRNIWTIPVPQNVQLKQVRITPSTGDPFLIDLNGKNKSPDTAMNFSRANNSPKSDQDTASSESMTIKFNGVENFSDSSEDGTQGWDIDLKITNAEKQTIEVDRHEFTVLDQFGFPYSSNAGSKLIKLLPGESMRTTISLASVSRFSQPATLIYEPENIYLDISTSTWDTTNSQSLEVLQNNTSSPTTSESASNIEITLGRYKVTFSLTNTSMGLNSSASKWNDWSSSQGEGDVYIVWKNQPDTYVANIYILHSDSGIVVDSGGYAGNLEDSGWKNVQTSAITIDGIEALLTSAEGPNGNHIYWASYKPNENTLVEIKSWMPFDKGTGDLLNTFHITETNDEVALVNTTAFDSPWNDKGNALRDKGDNLERSGDYNTAIECYMEASLAYSREYAVQTKQGNDDKSNEALQSSSRVLTSVYSLANKDYENGHYSLSFTTVPSTLEQPEEFYELINSSKIYLIQFNSEYNLDKDGSTFHKQGDQEFENVYFDFDFDSNSSKIMPGNLFKYFSDEESGRHPITNILEIGTMNIDGYPAQYAVCEAFNHEYTDPYGYEQNSYVTAGILYVQINKHTNLKVIVADVDDCLDLFRSIKIDEYSMDTSHMDEKATHLDKPDLASAWYDVGIILTGYRKCDEALNAFNKVIELDPKNASAWILKGAVLYIQEEYDEALIALNKGIELDPLNSGAWYYKGLVLKNLGRMTEADDAFAKSEELAKEPENNG